MRAGTLVLTPITALLAGCERRFDVPLERYEVRMEADARAPEACSEALSIRFEPVKVSPQVEGNLYERDTFSDKAVAVDKPVEDGAGNWECWFTYRSPALAPGKWLVVGEFANGSQSCLRDVGPGLPNRVRIDQEDGCVEHDPGAGGPVPGGRSHLTL
jgi:hypothetical protein